MKDIYFFSENPLEYGRGDEGMEISGWAIHGSQVYKDGLIEIPNSELENIMKTMKGRHLIKDHVLSTDNIVGRVMEARIGVDSKIHKRGVRYKAFVDDSKLENQIKKKLVDNCSIGFSLVPECSLCGEDFRECSHWFDEAHVIARDCNVHELSMVPIGADGDTTVEPGAAFSSQEDFTAQFSKEAKKANAMVNTEVPIGLTNKTTAPQSYTLDIPRTTEGWTPSIIFNYNDETQPTKDGEKMEELKEQVEGLKEEKTELLEQIEGLKEEKGELQEEIDTLKENETKLSEALEAYKNAEVESMQLAHEALVAEVIKLQLEKGVLTEDEVEEKTEELIGFEMEYLEHEKEVLERIKPEISREEPAVGRFDAQKNEPALPEEIEFDMEDKDLRTRMFKEMFKYPKK